MCITRLLGVCTVFVVLFGATHPQQHFSRLVSPFDAAEARNQQRNWAKAIGQPRDLTNTIGMKLVLIPPGEFMMGNSRTEDDEVRLFAEKYKCAVDPRSLDCEFPRHRVRIEKPFYVSTCDVTVGQFRQFIKSTGYKTDAEKNRKGGWGVDTVKGNFLQDPKFSWRYVGFLQMDEHPVVNVSWNDAIAFCAWLSQEEGKKYRLPTEAEWEYSCRAGTDTRYWCGDDPEVLARIANVADATYTAKYPLKLSAIHASDGYVFTSPAAVFSPNSFGLYDMHGNVKQWCADWYSKNYYGTSPVVDPLGPNSGTRRVLRGGSWASGAEPARCSEREGEAPEWLNDATGFRVVVDALKKGEEK